MPYDLRPYLYFVTVAEELSFTAAAAKLRVAQPWLSTAVRQLETRLGLTLFQRTTRRVNLTDEGQRLLPTIRAALSAVDQIDEAAQEIRDQEATLILGVPPYAIDMPATDEVIERFAYEHPQHRTQLDIGFSPSLTARAGSGEVHAAFTLGLRDAPAVEAFTLASFEMVIGFAPTDRLAQRAHIEPDDLRGRTVVTFPHETDATLFDQMNAPLLAAGAHLEESPKVWGHAYEPAAGQLVSTLNCKAASGANLRHRRLHWAPRVPYRLMRSRTQDSPAAAAFWAIAREVATARTA